ncbi:MAG: LysM peptidoglycan-binding domain-containing protein [Sandaracinaceae bacterium]
MKRARTLFIALAISGVSAPAAAQVGVYENQPQSLEAAAANREGIVISGNVRQRAVPEIYTVRRGDTLWDVTGRYYGNPWEWPRVWSYNPEVTNPHWIYPLDRLRLLPPNSRVAGPQSGPQVAAPVRRLASGTVFLRQEGYLDDEALEQAGVVVGSPDDHMLLAPYDQVYVEFEEDGPEPRGEYTIFREVDDDQRNSDEEGNLVRIYGAVRIDSYDRDRRTARATIIEALDPIERGYRIAAIPRRFDLVPPQVPDRDLESRVAATLRPRELLGEQQIIFVPVGEEDGVRLGWRFLVVESGDRWRDGLSSSPRTHGASVNAPDEPEQYPAEIVAEGRVVHVRPNSATVMITRSTREVEVGERAIVRQGY